MGASPIQKRQIIVRLLQRKLIFMRKLLNKSSINLTTNYKIGGFYYLQMFTILVSQFITKVAVGEDKPVD